MCRDDCCRLLANATGNMTLFAVGDRLGMAVIDTRRLCVCVCVCV